MPIDNLLPLIMQVSSIGICNKITFVFTEKEDQSLLVEGEDMFDPNPSIDILLQENSCLNEAIQSCGIRVVTVPYISHRHSKLMVFWLRLVTLKKMSFFLFGKVVSIGDRFGGLISALIRFNKIVYGGSFIKNRLVPFDLETAVQNSSTLEKFFGRSRGSFKVENCDAVVSTFTREEARQFQTVTGDQDIPVYKIGYARGGAVWHDMIVRNGRKNLEADIREKYVFYPLATLDRVESDGHVIDLEPSMVKVFKIFDKFAENLQIVFRYHPTTDRDKFASILQKSGLRNYAISYAHPHELIQNAQCTFSISGSSLFCDAFYLGSPVIHYIANDDLYFEKDENGNAVASHMQPVVDHFIVKDPGKLENVLRDLIATPPCSMKRSEEMLSKRFPFARDEELVQIFEKFI